MIIELDSSLKEIVTKDVYDNNNSIKFRCMTTGSVVPDYKNKTTTYKEKIFNHSLNDKADLKHINYLDYLQQTYATHNNIVLAPQNVWYDIVCDVAQIVIKDSEQYRSLFTRKPEGKVDIVIQGSETEPLRIYDIYNKMLEHIPIDSRLFLPKFTCSTEKSNAAILGAFLETCSPYYNYIMLACGHPRVKILGTLEDWEMLLDHTERLRDTIDKVTKDKVVKDWMMRLALSIRALFLAIKDQDANYFRKIYTQKRCGSGSQYDVDGWYSRFWFSQPSRTREITNFDTHITKIPYTTLPSGTEWNLCFGLFNSIRDKDGFMIPEFEWVQVQKLSTPIVE